MEWYRVISSTPGVGHGAGRFRFCGLLSQPLQFLHFEAAAPGGIAAIAGLGFLNFGNYNTIVARIGTIVTRNCIQTFLTSVTVFVLSSVWNAQFEYAF